MRMRQTILKGGALAIIDQGIVSVSNFITGVIVAKAVAPEEFGTYSLFFAGLMLLSGLQNACVTGPLGVLGIRHKDMDDTAYFSTQTHIQLLLGTAQLVGVVLILSFFTEIKAELIVSFAACIFLLQLQQLGRVIHLTKLNMLSLLGLDIVTHAMRVAVLLILAGMGSLSSSVTFGAIALSSLVGILWTWRKLELRLPGSGSLTFLAKENWNFGRWLFLETLASSASTQVYLFAMALWLDKQAVAVLAALQILLNVMNVLVTGVVNYAIPVARRRLTESGYLEWRRWLWRTGGLLTCATAVFGLIISIVAQELLSFIYTPFYAQFAYLVPLLAVAYCFRTVNSVLIITFRTANMPQVGVAAKFASAVATMIIIYPLLIRYGIVGSVVGLLITQILWMAVFIYYISAGYLSQVRVAKEVDGLSA